MTADAPVGRPTRRLQQVEVSLTFEDGTVRGVRVPIANIPDATRIGALVGTTIVEQLGLTPSFSIPVVTE